jgi:hypothetical protein
MVDISQPIVTRAAERKGRTVPMVPWRMFGRQGEVAIDFSLRQIAALFAVLTVITSVPIVVAPWPPLADYMNHLSRMHVIATIGTDPDLARFYEINWQVIPNLMMDLIVPLFERAMNVYLAGQVFTIGSFVLIISGMLALNRRLFGQWSIMPLIAFPLLYNNVFLVGTMNYVFGMGLAIWALAAWVWLRGRNIVLRLAVSSAFVLALFFCHLFAVGLYGLALLAFEIHRLFVIYSHRRRQPLADLINPLGLRPVIDFMAGGLAFAPVVPLLAMSPTWSLRGGLGMRHRAMQFHSFGWVLLVLGAIVYLAMPRVMFETYMADQRLPISLAFMIIACAQISLRHDAVRRGFATVLVVLLAIRVFEVQTVWSDMSQATASFRDSVRLIERGAKVLVAYADPDGGDDVRDYALVHAACLAIIERSALVTTAFTVQGKQIMHVRDEYRPRVDSEDGTPPSIGQLLQVADGPDGGSRAYWNRWTADYDYMYVLFTDGDYENPDPARLTPVYAGERFVLYRINSAHIADASVPLQSKD